MLRSNWAHLRALTGIRVPVRKAQLLPKGRQSCQLERGHFDERIFGLAENETVCSRHLSSIGTRLRG